MVVTQLNPDYYLSNFKLLICHALESYAHLLTKEELAWIDKFHSLTQDAQCLIVRLLSRQGDWFRSDKLSYDEIKDLSNALIELSDNALIKINPNAEPSVIAEKLLTKPEISYFYPQILPKMKKTQQVFVIEQDALMPKAQYPFDVIYLNQGHHLSVFCLLFFANSRQDLSQFVLSDLGLNSFETYELSADTAFFTTRQQIENLLKIADIRQQLDNEPKPSINLLVYLAEQLPKPAHHAYSDRKLYQLANQLARHLERQGEYSLAQRQYQTNSLPPSRERQARIHLKLGQLDAASDVVTEIISNPANQSEREIAKRLQDKILRSKGQSVPRTPKPDYRSETLSLDLSQQRVELAVLNTYQDNGYQCFFTENHWLNGLLVLALWPAIFANVEGAFINRYQHAPLDLYHSDFYLKRSEIIEKELQYISQHGFSHLLDRYDSKLGLSNPFVVWQHFPREALVAAIESLPKDVLVQLITVQLTDLKLYRSGMPDLVAFKNNDYLWIEVKGPGDKLQDNQLRWFRHFNQLSVNFKVAFVVDNN